MRTTLVHAKSEHEPRNNDDSATKAKHSRQQSSANAKRHQYQRALF
jgi:hypothetical protein